MNARDAKLQPVDPHDSDAAARQAIGTDLDRNFVVEAAAGTGKTTDWSTASWPCSDRGAQRSIVSSA
jgi:hypothetical protein